MEEGTKTNDLRRQTYHRSIVDLYPTLSVTILNVNGLNIPIKRQLNCHRGLKISKISSICFEDKDKDKKKI